MPDPDPPLKIVPSSRYQLRIPSIVSSTARMKHGARLLRRVLHPDVEPDRRVERGALGHEDELQLGAEGIRLGVVGEVAVAHAPIRDRVGHAVDDLAQRPLALLGAEGAAEVLLGDDVRRVQRPGRGELDLGLEEGVGAVLVVGDARVAPLPDDPVVGMLTLAREVPTDPDSDLLRRHRHVCGSLPRPLAGAVCAAPQLRRHRALHHARQRARQRARKMCCSESLRRRGSVVVVPGCGVSQIPAQPQDVVVDRSTTAIWGVNYITGVPPVSTLGALRIRHCPLTWANARQPFPGPSGSRDLGAEVFWSSTTSASKSARSSKPL